MNPGTSNRGLPTPKYVILSVAAGRKPRLGHSLAATEGPVAAAAPRFATRTTIRRCSRASAAWVREPTQDPSAAAKPSCASLHRPRGGAQDDMFLFACFDRVGRSGRATESTITKKEFSPRGPEDGEQFSGPLVLWVRLFCRSVRSGESSRRRLVHDPHVLPVPRTDELGGEA